MKKITKQFFAALLAAVILVAATPFTSVFASPANNSSQTTVLSYTAEETEWTWAFPATQIFTDDSLVKNANVSISPNNARNVIVLPANTEIFITMTSANDFNLVSETTASSRIPYVVSRTSSGACISSGDELLRFVAGTSSNTGISQTLYFSTTAANIENATVTGLHADVCTFTLNVVDTFTYEILSGANQMNYGVGSASFRSSGPYDEFNKVVIDSVDVNPSNYTTSEGSTWVTLPQSYLATLPVGTHTIDIVSDGGTASTQFTLWRDGEVTYEDNDIYYYPTSSSSVQAIRAGHPQNGDCVVYGDYVYYYVDAAWADEMWARATAPDSNVFVALVILELLGNINGLHQVDEADPEWNSGWVCLFAGVDPLSVHANQDDGSGNLDVLEGLTVDYSRSVYGQIESYIHSIPVISLCQTFCSREDVGLVNDGAYSNLLASPAIPNTVITLGHTYSGSGLSIYPTIPSSVYTILDPFEDCSNIEGHLYLNMNEVVAPTRVLTGITSGTTILDGTMSYANRQAIAESAEEGLTVILAEDYTPPELEAMLNAAASMTYDEALSFYASEYPSFASKLADVSVDISDAYEDVTIGDIAEDLCAIFGVDLNAKQEMIMILLELSLATIDYDSSAWTYVADSTGGAMYCDYSPFYRVAHIAPLNFELTVTDTRTLTDWVSDELGETVTVSAGLTGSRAIDLVDTLVTFGNTLGYDNVTRFTASALLEAMLTELVDTSLSITDANAALETEMPGVTTYLYFTESGTIRTLVLAPIDSSISFEY